MTMHYPIPNVTSAEAQRPVYKSKAIKLTITHDSHVPMPFLHVGDVGKGLTVRAPRKLSLYKKTLY